jgi:hypothetical protein
VVRRAGVVLGLRADEGPVLDAGHVAGIRQREVGVRPLGVGEPLERARVHERLAEPVVLLRAPVAPLDLLRLAQGDRLVNPVQQSAVGGRDRGFGGHFVNLPTLTTSCATLKSWVSERID